MKVRQLREYLAKADDDLDVVIEGLSTDAPAVGLGMGAGVFALQIDPPEEVPVRYAKTIYVNEDRGLMAKIDDILSSMAAVNSNFDYDTGWDLVGE